MRLRPTPETDAEETAQMIDYNRSREVGDPPFSACFEFARRMERSIQVKDEYIADLEKDLVAAVNLATLAGNNLTLDQKDLLNDLAKKSRKILMRHLNATPGR